MENREIFNYLMDIGAAHQNSYEEALCVFESVFELADNVCVQDAHIWRTEEADSTYQKVHRYSQSVLHNCLQLFADCTGMTMEDQEILSGKDPNITLNGEVVGKIISDYAEYLRANNKTEDIQYKDRIWELLQKDPLSFRQQ